MSSKMGRNPFDKKKKSAAAAPKPAVEAAKVFVESVSAKTAARQESAAMRGHFEKIIANFEAEQAALGTKDKHGWGGLVAKTADWVVSEVAAQGYLLTLKTVLLAKATFES